MTQRKLVTLRTIDRILPHKNADRLEVAIIGGWPAVVGKGQFEAGEQVIFCEVDTLLPPRPEYDFLAKSCSHKEGDELFYRIQTVRLRGQLSQGLVLPLSAYTSIMGRECRFAQTTLPKDGCFDSVLRVRKYERPISPQLSGVAKGPFPDFIPKTDEERIQNLDIQELEGKKFFRSEKLDGSSCTVYELDGHVGVCSRNLELEYNPDTTFWKTTEQVARFLKLPGNESLAVQGEVVGPGIQGNPYKLGEHRFYAFNMYYIKSGVYLQKSVLSYLCRENGIRTVPELGVLRCPCSVDEILDDAIGWSLINPNVEREGVVWVHSDGLRRVSFKAISNNFLLSHGK